MSTTEWVEIIEPRTKEHMFANLTTGECVWDPPVGVPVKKTDDNQWWELFDQNTSRFYYYNATSQKTVWHRPSGCDIIPLAKLQTLKQRSELQKVNVNSEQLHSSNKSDDKKLLSNGTPPSREDSFVQTPGSRLTKLGDKSRSGGSRTKIQNSSGAQTSPTASPRPKRVRHPRCKGAHNSTPGPPITKCGGGSHRMAGGPSEPVLLNGGMGISKRTNGSVVGSDRRSLDGGGAARHNFNNNGSRDSVKYYSMPQGAPNNVTTTPLVKSASSASQYASARYGVNSGGSDISNIVGSTYVYQVPLAKQRSLEGENFRVCQQPNNSQPVQLPSVHGGGEGSLARSVSFLVRNRDEGQINGVTRGTHHVNGTLEEGVIDPGGRRSVESTPQSGRRYGAPHSPPEYGGNNEGGYTRGSGRGAPPGHSRNSSVSSMSGHGAIDGFPTPMINRRTGPQGGALLGAPPTATSESEDSSHSPAKERRTGVGGQHPRPKTLSTELVDSGVSTLTDPEVGKSNHSLNQNRGERKMPTFEGMKERSLTCLSFQPRGRFGGGKPRHQPSKVTHSGNKGGPLVTRGDGCREDKSPSLNKISPLQQYILEQAKLSGYRWGEKTGEKRDSFIDSENESHRTGDDSDAFADDEAPSSDGGQEDRDDISLVSTVSSVGEDDTYLSEPTYNNLDPVWAQRHGFGPDNPLDIDTFSEEFDLRMRFGRGPSSTCSTIPRPTFSSGSGEGRQHIPAPHPRPGSAAPSSHLVIPSSKNSHHRHDFVDGGGLNDHMTQSQLSDNTGSTLSVSASIHSTLSAGTLTDFENFAASNLNIQKKGIFRKKMSLKDVLSWQAESISKPLTFVNEKSMKKEALAVFKMVQIYMSDRKAKVGMTINSVAQDIAESGFGNLNLRDEIYIQLCKQISDNPRRESLRRGWELLAICLAFFPPSETFYPYLLGFIQKHRDPNMDFPDVGRWPIHVQISHYAGICNKRLERIGVGGRLKPKKPTLEDIDQSRLQIFRPSMFGGMLGETLAIQKDKFPSRRLPWILTTLTEQILALNGLGTEGIFRIPADYDEVMSVKCRFDQWEMGQCSDAHVPAALLKQWLRELYIPLIPDTDNFYNEAVRVGDEKGLAISLVAKLPELHRLILIYLIRFLQLFARQEIVSVTKMDASNLSMVFAPNFLRCPFSDPIIIMENTRKEMAFVKTLIHSLDTSSMEGVL